MSIVQTTQYDLVEAVIAQLESNESIQTLFGDTWNQAAQTGTPKFFTDLADQVPIPYCLIEETGETYEYMTASGPGLTVAFTSPGQMKFMVFAGDRASCRQLGFAVAKSLNDAPLQWPGLGNFMLFRMSRSWFMPVADPSGPGVPVLFCRVFLFDYQYSANLGIFT